MSGRDRNARGRPQNARPRDGLGRPLPRGTETNVERIPDDLEIGGAEAAGLGASLLAQGRPFHAHEVFEAAWKTGPAAERELWQGLAQIAVGLTHARRGNPKGAVSLLRRGAGKVRDYRGTSPSEIDTSFIAERAETIAATIERDGLAAVAEAALRFPLRP